MTTLSWRPRRRGDIYCSPACGANCTHDAFEAATKAGNDLARRLGPAWRADIWENLGWHYCAVSLCGRWKIHANIHHGKVTGYTAFLGEPNHPGGRWAESGKSPKAAIRATRKRASEEVESMASLLYAAIGTAILPLCLALAPGCTALTDFDRFHYAAAEPDAAYDPEEDAGQDPEEDAGQPEHDAGMPEHDAGMVSDAGQGEPDAGPEEPAIVKALEGTWHATLTRIGSSCYTVVTLLKQTWTVDVQLPSTVQLNDGTKTWPGTLLVEGVNITGFDVPGLKLQVRLTNGELVGQGTFPTATTTEQCANVGVGRTVKAIR